MGLRDDLYKDIDKLFQRRLLKTSRMREKSLEAIREGRMPEGVGARMTDVVRWVLEDREMRLRRKRDLAVLYAEWQMDKDARTSELIGLLDEYIREREVTHANWKRVEVKVRGGKALVDRRGYRGSLEGLGLDYPRSKEQYSSSPGQSLEEEEYKTQGWQLEEWG